MRSVCRVVPVCLVVAAAVAPAPARAGEEKVSGKTAPEWLAQLKTGSPSERREAAAALGQFPDAKAEVLPALRAILAKPSEQRGWVVDALDELGPLARELVGDIAKILRGGHHESRAALHCLRRMGPDAAPAVPELVAILKARAGGATFL
jgi:hypothetical protein